MCGQGTAYKLHQGALDSVSRLGQSVVHPGSLPSCLNEPQGAENPEVPGDFKGRFFDRLGEVADTGLSVKREKGDEPESDRLAESLEEDGNIFQSGPLYMLICADKNIV